MVRPPNFEKTCRCVLAALHSALPCPGCLVILGILCPAWALCVGAALLGRGLLSGSVVGRSIPKLTKKTTALKTQPRKKRASPWPTSHPTSREICKVVGECSVDLLLTSGGPQRMVCWHVLTRRQTQLLKFLRLHPKHMTLQISILDLEQTVLDSPPQVLDLTDKILDSKYTS